MATNVTTIDPRQPSEPPSLHPGLSRSLDILLSGASRQDGRTNLLPGKSLTAGERTGLEARAGVLARSLEHRDNRELGRIVAEMLASYPSARAGGDEARMVIAAYVSSLSDLPPWAVAAAARQWARGKAGSDAPAFPPSSAQLYASAEAIVSRLRLERARVSEALEATEHEPSETERSRVAAGFDDLLAEFGRKRSQQADALSDLERRCRDLGLSPDVIDAVPDQPARKQVGTWSKLSAQPERTEA